MRSIGRPRDLRGDGSAAEVDRVERFLNVERARFAVAVEAVPIEEPERCVAGLLDLGDHHPSPSAWTVPASRKMQSPMRGSI